MTYEEACVAAATDQGLDPIVAALEAAGVPVSVEQTGGFCMVAYVYGESDGPVSVGITDAETIGSGESGALVCRVTWDGNASIEEAVANACPLDELAALVRLVIAGRPTPCIPAWSRLHDACGNETHQHDHGDLDTALPAC